MAKNRSRRRNSKSGSNAEEVPIKHRNQDGTRQQTHSFPQHHTTSLQATTSSSPLSSSSPSPSSSSSSSPSSFLTSSSTYSHAQESPTPPHQPFSKKPPRRIIVSSDSEEESTAKPLLRAKQRQSRKAFKSSPSSIIQHRQRKLLQYRPQQQLARRTTKRRDAVVPSGSSSGFGKREHSPARSALKATVAPLTTDAQAHAEKLPVRPPPPPLPRFVANPSNLIIISSCSEEEDELLPHVQPRRKQVLNTIKSSATTQSQKHNVLPPPPPRPHPAGTAKQNNVGSKDSSSDPSPFDSTQDSSSGMSRGFHTPTSSAPDMTPAQMMTVIHTQEERYGPSPYLQSQSSTTTTDHVVNSSDSEKVNNMAVQPTQTADITNSPIVFVPESDEESHMSPRPSLPRRGVGPLQLICIKSSHVDKHPHPPHCPRPRPLRLRVPPTRVNAAPVAETSLQAFQDVRV